MSHASRLSALIDGIKAGRRGAVARALNVLDDSRPSARDRRRALFAALPRPESILDTHVVGFTGPPGAGKSTLISRVIAAWRAANLTVGVLAADPSSPISGGALLGDRLRMQVPDDDTGTFIRSVANRGSYGGLTPELLPMAAVMIAAFDRVLVETVGVGQREVDVADAVDSTCLVVQPGAGDNVQYLKAGIMEVPDLLVVTKTDLGAIAQQTVNDLMATFAKSATPVLATSASTGHGIDALIEALEAHHAAMRANTTIREKRQRAQLQWVVSRLHDKFGRFGIAQLGGERAIESELLSSCAPILAQFEHLHARTLNMFSSPVKHTDDSSAATLSSQRQQPMEST